jgi:hypothetical protein
VLDRRRWTLAAGTLFACALALPGCSSSIADMPGVGVPADAPPRPKEAGAYLPVNDLPANRDEATLDAKERARIEAELIAARDRQAVTTPTKGSTRAKDAARTKDVAHAKDPASAKATASDKDAASVKDTASK